MTPSGLIAVLVLLVTNAGTLIAAYIAVQNMRHSHSKEDANRRIILERYADDVGRYHRSIRAYLLELADTGVIDESRVDLTKFPPPPLPTINGNNNH